MVSTQVTVATDCLRVQHRDEVSTIALPGKTSLGMARLPISSHSTTALTWRLPLEAPDQVRGLTERETPWSAADLQQEGEFQCRSCKAVIVKHGAIRAWKDLPSENWAEMMEFWHCHKPDHHHHHHEDTNGKADDASLAARGYGANSAIQSREGTGLVDLTAFLLSETDCVGLAVRYRSLHLQLSHFWAYRRWLSQAPSYNGIATDTNALDQPGPCATARKRNLARKGDGTLFHNRVASLKALGHSEQWMFRG